MDRNCTETLLDSVKHLPHDAYWDGFCARCGRVRRLCEALRKKFDLVSCNLIKDCKLCGGQYNDSRHGSCGCFDNGCQVVEALKTVVNMNEAPNGYVDVLRALAVLMHDNPNKVT